jgi:anaerobic ribonucleoside-triphosphate reductase activating protein
VKISINKAHFPVTVLGPGRRIGIWFQGCSIHCKGCISLDTWERDAGRDMDLAHLVAWCRETATAGFDGITISGGEPFDQPKALEQLLDAFHGWRRELAADFDILCYSGYPLSRLQKHHGAILRKLDALIAEPYVDALPLTHLWRGSSNQPLVPLSERGQLRFGAYLDARADGPGKRIQAAVDGKRVWYIGIPARGDMPELEKACAERGVKLSQVSWRQ